MNYPKTSSILEVLVYYDSLIIEAIQNEQYMVVQNLTPITIRLLDLLQEASAKCMDEQYAEFEDAMDELEEEDE